MEKSLIISFFSIHINWQTSVSYIKFKFFCRWLKVHATQSTFSYTCSVFSAGKFALTRSAFIFAALTNEPCLKDHVEEEGIIFLAILKSHDRLQRSPFTSLIAAPPSYPMSWLFVSLLCTCAAPDQAYIKSASISWLKWSLLRFVVGQLHLLKRTRGFPIWRNQVSCRCSRQQPKLRL